jgi:DNA-binding CsgD family transcriptional regulator
MMPTSAEEPRWQAAPQKRQWPSRSPGAAKSSAGSFGRGWNYPGRLWVQQADERADEGSRLSTDEPIDAALHAAIVEVNQVRSSALTPRELEVADLVAAGLTNREIAHSLVISTRTVESHIDHIKVKLGFTRRARIVAWALERAYHEATRRQTNPRNYG